MNKGQGSQNRDLEIERLSGQKILVVGAAGGIGQAVVAKLAGAGAQVMAAGRGRPSPSFAHRAVVECDVTDPESVGNAVAASIDILGGLTGLVYVSGTGHRPMPIADVDMNEWNQVFNVNVKGLIRLAKHVVPSLAGVSGASIVAISSWWGQRGHAYFAPYCASKAALISIVQSMADELASVGIRINSVSPGSIDTSMHRDAIASKAEKQGLTFDEVREFEWSKIPLGHAGPPSCIADAVEFLLSPRASYITGATLDVNGGVLYR